MLVKRNYYYSILNGLFWCRPRLIQRTHSAIRANNKCLHMPSKSVPLLHGSLSRSVVCLPCKFYCTEDKTVLPNVMDFPVFAWPSIIKSCRNWLLSHFIIMRYFDKDFNVQDFVDGSKKAVEVVSGFVSRGDLGNLQGLVTPDAVAEVKKSLSNFNMAQRQQLATVEDDIYFSFPYEIGVIFPNEGEGANQQRYVEITMCYHILQGLREMKENGDDIPINIGMIPEFKEKIYICNYRFVREFTKGIEGQWTINAFNHVRPADQFQY